MPLHLGNTDDVSLRHRCTDDESLNGADTTSLCSFCGKNLRSIRRNGSLGRHRVCDRNNEWKTARVLLTSVGCKNRISTGSLLILAMT